jgi:hypothetical protein
MRKIAVTFFLCAITIVSEAQVTIQATLPTVGLVQKNQLWNLLVINSTVSSMEGRLELVLRDRQTGVELMTATTARFTLPKGSMQVNVNKLNPVQYNYTGLDLDASQNGLLPVGAYTACYLFTKFSGDRFETIAEECVQFDAEPLSPPMLLFPSDSSELEISPAQFTWTPPTPAGMFRQVHYEILITEINEGQKPNEALQENPAFYSNDIVRNNFTTYPAALPAFEKEKWYAWQIVARDESNYSGKSEIWVFKIKKQSEAEKIIKGTPYMKMKPENPETGIAPNGILKISYFNRTIDSTLNIVVRDLTAESSNGKGASVPMKVVFGENQLQINLKKLVSLAEDHTYQAEITNSKGEKNTALFRVIYFKD